MSRRKTRVKSRLIGLTAGVTAVAGVVASLTFASASEDGEEAVSGAENVVFVQGNELDGNTIHAFKRSDTGELKAAGSYATGGEGGLAQDAPFDALASQGSLVYDSKHDLLLAVNAGSNTVTSFQVDGHKLSEPTTVDTGGDFPASVAVYGDHAYVLNAGGEGSLQGFDITDKGLSAKDGTRRSLGLDNDAVPVHTDSPAQVSFTPDGENLVVTTKSNNSIEVFPVDGDGAPAKKARTTPSEGGVPFGFTFDQGGRLVVTETEESTVSTYEVGEDGELETVTESVPSGQDTLCWIAEANGFFYGSNSGNSALTAYKIGAGGEARVLAPQAVAQSPDSRGPIDMSASVGGEFLYVQNALSGTVDGYKAEDNGKLTLVTRVNDGLPVFDEERGGMEGIVAI